MYRDIIQWRTIRKRVLIDKVSKRQVVKETGIAWHTLQRILRHPVPPCHASKGRRRTKCANVGPQVTWNGILESLTHASLNDGCELISALGKLSSNQINRFRFGVLRKLIAGKTAAKCILGGLIPSQFEAHEWMLRVVQGSESIESIRDVTGDIEGLPKLVQMAAQGKLRDRNRAISVLGHLHRYSTADIAHFLHRSKSNVQRHINRYRSGGIDSLFPKRKARQRRATDAELRKSIFSVLHSPPSDYQINRTTWKFADLHRILVEMHGTISKDIIREIIQHAGYRWKKARHVLTSPDPNYKEKLQRIQDVLSHLTSSERFFSIDEFGPCGVKMKGGRRLCGPNEQPIVPQLQKSKGWFVLVGALELSKNQMTHFFTKRKNTCEILRLLAILLEKYRDCSTLYVSWDAASWHASKKLYSHVAYINEEQYRAEHGTPKVELVPLPVSAQYLNVIESVFSGMARAIIHNSDYASLADAFAAVDRYCEERNEHFRKNPKRAGNKLWGYELVPSEFDASQNCKNPQWR